MTPDRWYLLIHEVPARPLYLRARIRRLLLAAGAAALKKAVYALPHDEAARAAFARIRDEIRAGGGDGFLVEASFVIGAEEEFLDAARRERRADYARILRAARALRDLLGKPVRPAALPAEPPATRHAARLQQLRTRLEQVRRIDHFGSGGDREVEEALATLARGLEPRVSRRGSGARRSLAGHTWVTRRGIGIDRIACAWVIRRFIDPAAPFRFADPAAVQAAAGELTFDCPDGDFTHEAGRCSVETLVAAARITDPAVHRIAEIVHDVDLADERFQHPETAGVAQVVSGIVRRHDADRERLERGLEVFDDLRHSFTNAARVRMPARHVAARPAGSRRRPS